MTYYTENVIDDETMRELVQMGKHEVRAESGLEIPDFYDKQYPAAERALFWTVCLFCKIHMGELEGLDFNVGEIKIHQLPVRDISRVWYEKLDTHIGMLRGQSAGMGIGRVNRANRTYGGSP
ncbi:hypothetical protein ACFQGT_09665 [Natrialbaceae archaeon GCM10025810]|uniref:hypothetical protein n=1 Tax=Halovalidus salilacus TaxID=3075124 RepID=UPI0036125350